MQEMWLLENKFFSKHMNNDNDDDDNNNNNNNTNNPQILSVWSIKKEKEGVLE
jgi:hypothetical protein